ncbi:MAG TPA: sigma-70 family RNA polymerase sigma factor, partial [Chitinophagaceae bacterium]|nr:sigma-70 family RNA polymerase sigma factor [Chitinophagaceae bacterium]
NKLQHLCNQPVKWQVNNNTGLNTTDRHLVDRVLRGESNAFGIIIKNTENLVAKIIFDMIVNDSDRKDIAQDIYLKVYQKLPGFKFQSKLSTWIGQICYNTCIDHLRKKKLVLTENIFETETDQSNEILDMMNNAQGNFDEPVDTFVIGKNISEIVKKKIEKLPAIYKTLIGLFHNEELSYDEIGTITGLPAGTVKSYLFRARRELKNDLMLHYKKEDLW